MDKEPHHLLKTPSSMVREQSNKIRYAIVMGKKSNGEMKDKKSHKGEKHQNISINTEITGKTKHFQNTQLSGLERDANAKIERAMQQRLNYLQNPRNNKGKTSKLITLGNQTLQRGQINDNPNIPAPLFECDPSQLNFFDYIAGMVYKIPIVIRNVSTASRMARIVPPKDYATFQVSSLVYPTSCSSGLIAPGMSIASSVIFKPLSLRDYSDELVISTENGRLTVPIIARRQAPKLTIPDVFDVGLCLVGDAKRICLPCTNIGGSSNILISSVDHLESLPTRKDIRTTNCIQTSPFTLYPANFHMLTNQSQDIFIEFVPKSVGKFSQKYVVLFDNDDARVFSVEGESRQVDVSISGINSSDIDTSNESMHLDLFFDNVPVSSETLQTISIVNDSRVPLEYEWVLLSASKKLTQQQIMGMAEERINLRNVHQIESLSQNDANIERLEHQINDESADYMSARSDAISQVTSVHGMMFANPIYNDILVPSLSDHGEANHDVNRVDMAGFSITPCRGVFAGEGLETFTVSFSPLTNDIHNVEAVLVVKGVPNASVPNDSQKEFLDLLRSNGHGKFHRLCSWLENYSIKTKVDTFMDQNTRMYQTSKRIVSLKSLMNIVITSIKLSDAVESHLQEFLERCERLMDHVNRWLQNAIQAEDDDEEGTTPNSHPNEGQNSIDESQIHSFDQDHDHDQDKSTTQSINMPQSNCVSRNPSLSSIIDEDKGMDSTSPADPITVSEIATKSPKTEKTYRFLNSFYLDGSGSADSGKAVDAAKVYPLKLDKTAKSVDQLENLFVPTVVDYDPQVISPMIWLDCENSLLLIGDNLGDMLNEMVHHEAVEYIKEHSLTNVSCVHTKLAGKGDPIHISIDHPHVCLSGENPIGKEWKTHVTLRNPSSSVAEGTVQLENMVIRRLTQQSISEGIYPTENPSIADDMASTISSSTNNIDKFIVHVSPSNRFVLMAETSCSFEVCILGHEVGSYHIAIPISLSNIYMTCDCLTLTANIVPSKLRFDIPETDIGLIGVGLQKEYVLNFTNESNHELKYAFSSSIDVDQEALMMASVGMLSARPSRTSRTPLTHGGLSSSRSHTSKMNTNRSGETSPTGSILSSDRSYQIENPTATITFESNNREMVVQPYETASVIVRCKGGKLPQRLRGKIMCHIYDIHGISEINAQYINIRGEIQAPKAIVYPQTIDLSEIYVNVSVKFSITIENLCNLATKFKLDFPAGRNPSYSILFPIEKGVLNPKEKLTITGEIIGHTTTIIDEVVSVKIFGIAKPIGFVISAKVKSVSFEIRQLLPDASDLQPLCSKTSPQYAPIVETKSDFDITQGKFDADETCVNTSATHHYTCPDPISSEVLVFHDGLDIPLYEHSSIKIGIRNLSAIDLVYSLGVEKYGILTNDYNESIRSYLEQLEHNEKGSKMLARSAKPSNDSKYILQSHDMIFEERFSSWEGKKAMRAKLQQQDDKKYLQSKLGAAYLISPAIEGVMAAWSVIHVNVSAFNDTPGSYDDNLIFQYVDPVTRQQKTHKIPIRMCVSGCPLFIDRNTVGMSYTTSENGKRCPLLRIGHGFVNGNLLRRTFVLTNKGSNSAQLSWKILGVHSPNSKQDMSDDEHGVSIHPQTVSVTAYSQQAFVITLNRSDVAGKINIESECVVRLNSNDDGVPTVRDYTIRLLIEGGYHYPLIKVNDQSYQMADARDRMERSHGIHLATNVDAMFYDANHLTNGGPCFKNINICNPMESHVLLHASVRGPYAISSTATAKELHVSSDASAESEDKFPNRFRKSVANGVKTSSVFSFLLAPQVTVILS